jgi:predicted transcriptional regulator YheO
MMSQINDKVKKSKAEKTEDQLERRVRVTECNTASTRFFKFMVDMFIKHVLGHSSNHNGFYGKTSGYYGTVEQQGRLTLHMHMMIWIKHSLTSQELREKIMNPESDFQKRLVEYLESRHVGEFLTGTMSSVSDYWTPVQETNPRPLLPTEILPQSSEPLCKIKCGTCTQCKKSQEWWKYFNQTVDGIVFLSNVHDCTKGGCTRNKDKICKARFPREINSQTMVDPTSGALRLRKGEAWINTYTPLLTYLLKCNTDVTSLLSGTAIKAVVAYVTDYITKSPLKTHVIFDAVKSVFAKNIDVHLKSQDKLKKSRSVVTKIVNALTSQSEIGSPIASMYLLKHSDHYKSHNFQEFYWKLYVDEVKAAWKPDVDEPESDSISLHIKDDDDQKIVLTKDSKGIVGISSVLDYIYRPQKYSEVTLYDWIRLGRKVKTQSLSQI